MDGKNVASGRSARRPHRRHPQEFKQQVCREIREGRLGRRAAAKVYGLSDNLLQQWLARYDLERAGGGRTGTQALAHCEQRIEALERKVGQLTMALEECECRHREGLAGA